MPVLAEPSRSSTKTSPLRKASQPGAVPHLTQQHETNPLWEALALRSVGAQAKLAVSQPNDPHEREADRVADQVMRAEKPGSAYASSISLRIQRKCKSCLEEDENYANRKASNTQSHIAEGAKSMVNDALHSAGHNLDPVTRNFLEPRFGTDLSHVRVHTGSTAERAAEAVKARAFTVGSEVVFGRGEYSPGTMSGRRLLAHEVTHTLQQQAGADVRGQVQRTTYQDCTDDQLRNMILPAKTQALDDLRSVISSLDASPLSDLTTASLFLAFRASDPSTVSTVKSRLVEIRDGLGTGTIECEQPGGWQFMCERNRLGYTIMFGTIHLCMNAWPGVSQTLRAKNLIHEGAHAFSWLVGDPGYFDYHTCAETAATSRLGPASRLGVPDAYSCFVYYMRHDTGIPARAQQYRGANLAMTQTPAGPVDLNSTDVLAPMFTMTGVPQHSGFGFRWIVADSQNRSYLMRADTGNPFEFGNHPSTYIGAATRALLKERGITQAEVRCRVAFIDGTERLFTTTVQLTS